MYTLPKFKSEGITIKMGQQMKKELEVIATQHEMSQAEFVRYLIQKFIDDNKNEVLQYVNS